MNICSDEDVSAGGISEEMYNLLKEKEEATTTMKKRSARKKIMDLKNNIRKYKRKIRKKN